MLEKLCETCGKKLEDICGGERCRCYELGTKLYIGSIVPFEEWYNPYTPLNE